MQFFQFAIGHGVNHFVRNARVMHHLSIENAHAAAGDGAHGEFFVTGYAEFADNENVEGNAKGLGDLEGHRHAAAREREHDNAWLTGVMSELVRQYFAGLGPVLIAVDHGPPLGYRPRRDPEISPRCSRNHSAVSRATSSRAPGSSKRWEAPRTTRSSFSQA